MSLSEIQMMKLETMLESDHTLSFSTPKLPVGCWFDDACILDMDDFIRNLSGIKEKGVRPDLIASIITNYASKWLPDICSTDEPRKGHTDGTKEPPAESATALWMKKRFFVETLVGVLPLDKDSVPCNFLLRLLRTANMVGVDVTYRDELEKRISWQLDQASLKELMIPAFRHTCGTLLDVELVLRLVMRFVNSDETVLKSGVALAKVAKLVDGYLAEVALDTNLTFLEFIALAGILPSHARVTDDGLYRAIDTYLKVHPGVSKQERKVLCGLIDSQKLSTEATIHATRNERLPVRAVIQVLFTEHMRVNRQSDWSSSSFNGASRSPNPAVDSTPARCSSKRGVANQQVEIKKLREDVVRLQNQCNFMQHQIEKHTEKKKSFFRWKKLSVPLLLLQSGSGVEDGDQGEGKERRTPIDMKTKLVHGRSTPKWRKSMS